MRLKVVTQAKQSQQLQHDLLEELTKLGSALSTGKAYGVNFVKITELVNTLMELNEKINVEQKLLESGFLKTTFGRIVYTGMKVGAFGLCVAVGGLIMYDVSFGDNDQESIDHKKSALGALGSVITYMSVDLYKQFREEALYAVETSPPEEKRHLETLLNVVQTVQEVLTKQEVNQDKVHQYAQAYGTLPGSIQGVLPKPKRWDPALLGKLPEENEHRKKALKRYSEPQVIVAP